MQFDPVKIWKDLFSKIGHLIVINIILDNILAWAWNPAVSIENSSLVFKRFKFVNFPHKNLTYFCASLNRKKIIQGRNPSHPIPKCRVKRRIKKNKKVFLTLTKLKLRWNQLLNCRRLKQHPTSIYCEWGGLLTTP